MSTLENPFFTTVRNLRNRANTRVAVRHITDKIVEHGVCSDLEFEYLRQHTDWDQQYQMDKRIIDSE